MKQLQELGVTALIAGLVLAGVYYLGQQNMLPTWEWGNTTITLRDIPLWVPAVVIGGGVLCLLFGVIGQQVKKMADEEKAARNSKPQ